MPPVGQRLHKRADRVAELIREELGALLVNEVKDPRVGFVTVTEVRMSPDFRSGRVFISVYGAAEVRAESLAGIHAAAGFLRREIGRRVRLRYVPELTFHLDDTLDGAERIEELLEASKQGSELPPAQPEKNIAADHVHTQRSDIKRVAVPPHALGASKQRDDKSRGGGRRARRHKRR